MATPSSETRQQIEDNRDKSFDDLLSLEDRKFLLKNGKMHEADTGAVLCQQNQTSNELYLILQGEVAITENAAKDSKALGKLGAGDLFGEISALFSVPRIASAVASKPSVILQLEKEDFIALLERSPNLKDMVYKRLSQRRLQTSIQTQ